MICSCSAAPSPKPMPPSICARTTSGLTAMPQSTAHTTRSTLSRLVAHGDLDDLRHVAVERFVHRDAARAAFRQRLAPARLLRRELEHAEMTRMFLRAARGGTRPDPSRRRGELVDERLRRERRVRRADRAPPQHRHANLRRVQFDASGSGCRRAGCSRLRPTCASMPSFTINGSNNVPDVIDWPTMR